jgi:uncharacterized protein YndB with AHSA1/START domain
VIKLSVRLAESIFFLLLAGTIGFGLFGSNTYRVVRSIKINAPPEKVWMVIGDLDNWGEWFPWDFPLASYVTSLSNTEHTAEWGTVDGKGSGTIKTNQVKSPERICVTITTRIQSDKFTTRDCLSLTTDHATTQLTWETTGKYNGFGSRALGAITDHFIARPSRQALENIKTTAEKIN